MLQTRQGAGRENTLLGVNFETLRRVSPETFSWVLRLPGHFDTGQQHKSKRIAPSLTPLRLINSQSAGGGENALFSGASRTRMTSCGGLLT